MDSAGVMRTIHIGSYGECKQAALELYAARYGTNPSRMTEDKDKEIRIEHPNQYDGNYFAVVEKWENQTEEWKPIYAEMREHDKNARC